MVGPHTEHVISLHLSVYVYGLLGPNPTYENGLVRDYLLHIINPQT